MTIDEATTAGARVDGRRARRDRGRIAVTEATIDLVLEGHLPPTAEQIAARAGVSVASIFRYFESLDELRRETIRRYDERFAHLNEIPGCGEGDLAGRIERYVAVRLHLYATVEPMAQLARSRAGDVTAFDDTLRRSRASVAEQIRQHFAPELDRLTPARRDDRVALIATTTSFESWVQLRDEYERNPAQARRAWTTALELLLGDA